MEVKWVIQSYPTLCNPMDYTWTGKQTLGRYKQNLLCTRPKKREHWPCKRLTQTCPEVSRSLCQRLVSVVACCRAGGAESSRACMGPCEGGPHCLHYLHHSLAPGKQQGPNWFRDASHVTLFFFFFLKTSRLPRTCSSHGKMLEALCWSSCEEMPHLQGKRNPSGTVGVARGIRGQTDWNHNHRKWANLITGPQPCLIQWN